MELITKTKIFIFSLIFFGAQSKASLAFYVPPTPSPGGGENGSTTTESTQTLNNPLSGIGVNSIGDLFTWVITTLLAFAGVAAVFVIIWAGYTLIFSGGNKDKVTQAKQRLLWALAGLVLIILSGFLVRIVLSIIN